MDTAAGTLTVWGDVTCPWATLTVVRLHDARHRLGLDDDVAFDLRAFPLELINGRTTPRLVIDAEIAAVGALAPSFGWNIWQGDLETYPGTVLLALEAVQAAKAQSLRASEELDLGLRRAFFAESRNVGARHDILEVAKGSEAVDVDALTQALDDGRARRAVIDQWHEAERGEVQGSPHVFLPDGTNAHNPGIEMHWEGEKPGGFPVIDADEPSVYDDLVRRAAEAG
jgi:predicted DsbA family dithiol-disulfide isomerase